MKLHTIYISMMAFFLLAGSSAAYQNPEKPYSLEDLYAAALEHAEQIGIAKQAVSIAEYTRRQALSVLQPTITAFGNYRRYQNEEIMGGSVIQPQWDSSYGLKAGQSFTLNGRELTALRIAEQGIDKSKLDLATVKSTYLFNVASAYYDVAKLQQAVVIAKTNVRRLETHRNAVELKLKLAEVPKTELFRTQAELSQAQADLIQAQNLLQVARAFLERLTGIAEGFEIEEPPPSEPEEAATSLAELKKLALDKRPELQGLSVEEKIAQDQVRYTRGAYWPRLGVEAGWMRLDQDPDPLLEESAYVAVNISVDLFDGGLRRSRVGAAAAQQRQAELNRKDAERGVSVEVERSWRNLKTQQSILQSFKSQLLYAKENYDAVIRLFENGMANSVDVMDANTLLVTAERQLSEAGYNQQLAALDLERATGTFLERVREPAEKTSQQ